jgi:DNA-binding MarR family transcriptional regulator
MKQGILPRDREILSLITELSKAVRCCRQDEVFCEGVTLSQFIILDAVARGRSLSMASLHDVLAVDKSTTTRLVTPLVRRGLVVREKAAHDSRAATLKLTGQGKQVHGDVWQCLLPFLRGIEAQLPERKRDNVFEGMRSFLGALQRVSLMRCEGDAGPAACGCAGREKNGKQGKHCTAR